MDRMTAILPLEKQTVSRNILPRRVAFEVLYHLNCDNLCSDFQEDLSFKFSLGFSALMARFMAGNGGKKRNGHQSYNPSPYGGLPSFPRTSGVLLPSWPLLPFHHRAQWE